MDIGSKHVFAETNSGEVINDLDHLILQVWYELDGQVSRARIRRVAMKMAAGFRDAPVTMHILLWVRHLTREWLKEEIKKRNPSALDRVSCRIHPSLPGCQCREGSNHIRRKSCDVHRREVLYSVKAAAFDQRKGDE
jgi:hypothetical protein